MPDRLEHPSQNKTLSLHRTTLHQIENNKNHNSAWLETRARPSSPVFVSGGDCSFKAVVRHCHVEDPGSSNQELFFCLMLFFETGSPHVAQSGTCDYPASVSTCWDYRHLAWVFVVVCLFWSCMEISQQNLFVQLMYNNKKEKCLDLGRMDTPKVLISTETLSCWKNYKSIQIKIKKFFLTCYIGNNKWWCNNVLEICWETRFQMLSPHTNTKCYLV
jgi:hypothetical protein